MRKLRIIASVFALVLMNGSYAQTPKGCGFNYAQEKIKEQYPAYEGKLKELEQQITNTQNKLAATDFTIPVVFHVLHLGGSENISDAQIQDAVSILNTDFKKKNPDTISIVNEFKPLAANCRISFVLASKDPDGKCTNGITRHYTNKTDWDVDFNNYVYTWPSNQYLNVYVVRSMPNAAGYTFLPGTVPAIADVIVILDNYVGSIGTGSSFLSRALTHEVGHWLGLPHVWGSTNSPGVACGDDGVSDTPLTKGHSWCSLGNAIDCTPGITENIQNYMEYAYCSNMFTIGQANLMNGILNSPTAGRNNVVSNSNHVATGILNPNYNCAPKAEFGAGISMICQNNSATFVDQSYNGVVSSWQWSSPAANGISTAQMGVLTFTASGLQPVQLKVGNGFGSDSTIKVNYITVLSYNGTTVNVTEGFDGGSFPNDRWIATQPQYGSSFVQTTNAFVSGNKSMYVNNYLDNPNEPVSLISPRYDLSNVTGAQLTFKYAYAQQSNNQDKLRVFVSDDCGSSWSVVKTKSGTGLSTAPSLNGSAFVPSNTQWNTEVVALGSYEGQSNVYVKFEFTPDANGPGNNFFLEDVNLTGTVGIHKYSNPFVGTKVFPNPSNGEVNIRSVNGNMSKVCVMNNLGQILIEKNDLRTSLFHLNMEELAKGLYLMEVTVEGQTSVHKLVIE